MADKEVIITYETLYELLRKEKYRKELQKLEESFLVDVQNYISQKKAILESQQKKESIFSLSEVSKTQKQLENVGKILRNLYDYRENKIIQLAVFRSRVNKNLDDKSTLLNEEAELIEELTKTLKKYRTKLLEKLFNENHILKLAEEPKGLKKKDENVNPNKKICFKIEVPEFVGEDLKTYGPFKKGDKMELPPQAASLLIKQEKAEEI